MLWRPCLGKGMFGKSVSEEHRERRATKDVTSALPILDSRFVQVRDGV
jgi:hypothetical protein